MSPISVGDKSSDVGGESSISLLLQVEEEFCSMISQNHLWAMSSPFEQTAAAEMAEDVHHLRMMSGFLGESILHVDLGLQMVEDGHLVGDFFHWLGRGRCHLFLWCHCDSERHNIIGEREICLPEIV